MGKISGVEQNGEVGLEIDRGNFVLEQISFQEYLFYKMRRGCPALRVEEFGNGFGRIVSPIEEDAVKLLAGFSKLPHAKRRNGISVDMGGGRWRKFNSDEIDEEAAVKVIELARKRRGLIEFAFSARSYNTKAKNNLGFSLEPDGRAISVYCCIPGHLGREDFVWRGENREFDHVYGILKTDW